MAISNFLLKMQDVLGASKELAGGIEVESWSFSISAPVDEASKQLTGKRTLGDFVISKWIDKASPILLMAVDTNLSFPKVTLELRHMENGKSVKYYEIELKNARVRAVTVKGPGPLAVPTEVVNISYRSGSCTFTNGGISASWGFDSSTE